MALDSVQSQRTVELEPALKFTDFMPRQPAPNITSLSTTELQANAQRAQDIHRFVENNPRYSDNAPLRVAMAGDTASDKPPITLVSNPQDRAIEEISVLKERVTDDERTRPGSLRLGEDLHDLGAKENFVGNYKDASGHLARSVEILRQQPQSAEVDQALMQTLYDYGVSLVRPMTGENKAGENKATVLADRAKADGVFDEAIALAQQYGIPARDQLDLFREKGNNQVFIASGNDINTETGKAAYRQGMQTAIETFDKGLALMQGQDANPDLAATALATGDLAFAEMHLANSATDRDALASEQHFEQAISLWDKYQPPSNEASDARDKTEIAHLAQYYGLLKLMGKTQRAQEIDARYQKIIARHPDIHIQR